MSTIPTLWEPFGLRGNPFFQSELRSGDEAHPISLFVGREGERQRVLRRVGADTSTRTIIQGAPGVGKSSFVNRIKADMVGRGVSTYDEPIRIDSRTTRASFIADVLRTLLRIRLAAGLSNAGDIWARAVRLLEGQDLVGGGVSVLGVGATVSRGYIAPRAPADSLYEHLGAALEELGKDRGAPVLLHVNNLESLALNDLQAAGTLVLDLRDYLLLPGAHWVFVGATGIEEAVFRAHAQVSGIFPQAITLGPLPPPDVASLLESRYEHFQIAGESFVPPVEPEAAAHLYALYQGDLRNFLRLLTESAEALLGVDGVRPITSLEIRRFGSHEYALRLRQRLGEDDFAHAGRILEAYGAEEFRVTEVARATALSQAASSKLVQRLELKQVFHPTRAEGRSQFYRALGEVLIAFEADPTPLLR